MSTSLRLGTVWGIVVDLDYSWFLVLALLTYLLSVQYFPANYAPAPELLYWLLGLAGALLACASVLAHELAHALVAPRVGAPVRGITLFLFGGMARLTKDPPTPRGELLLALVGPAASLTLAAGFALLWWGLNPLCAPAAVVASWVALANVALGAFNLLPGHPLDGGRALRALTWWQSGSESLATTIAGTSGAVLAAVIILCGLWLARAGSPGDGLWLAAIGAFLGISGEANRRRTVLHEALHGVKAGAVLSAACPVVYPGTPGDLRAERRPPGQATDVPSGDRLAPAPADRASRIPCREEPAAGAVPIRRSARIPSVRPEDEALAVLALLEEGIAKAVPVIAEGRLLGLLRREDIARYAARSRRRPRPS